MQYSSDGSGFYIGKRVALMILLDQPWGLNVVSRFPGVVTFRISHPFYKILQLSSSPIVLVITNGLDFILLIITNKVRWGPGVVFSVFDRFDV